MKNRHYIIPIFVPHLGCPHNCVFCNQNAITGEDGLVDGKFVRDTAQEYLRTMKEENRTVELSFFGGTFTAIDENKQKELLREAKILKHKGLINFIRLSTRPDYINEHILEYLKEYEVDIIELGVQSLDEEVLRLSGRGHGREEVYKASKLIKDANITLGLQMMIGLPGDNEEKDIKTAEEIIKLKPAMVRIYPSLVIKNTPMEKMYIDGQYKPLSLTEAVNISKKLLIMFRSENINVIRIGLQPTEEISPEHELVAGPYHPAFRELTESKLIMSILESKLKKGKAYDLFVNPKYISRIYAGKKIFFNDMKKHLETDSIKVYQDEEVLEGYIGIRCESLYTILSLQEEMSLMYREGIYKN